jgi:site-specific DNA-methyltransferase (adenine-specific)
MEEWLAAYDGPLFDSCVTDPPYHLTSIVKRFGKSGSAACKEGATGAYARAAKGFMGKEWDGGDIAFRPETWRAVFDKLKPGAHLVAFSGTRTFHRMVCAIEDAGFEIRDSIMDLFDANPLAQMFMESLSEQQRDMFARLLDQQQFTGLLLWAYGSGFPKSHNQKGEWEGWGTALKPALEPICLARKPLSEKSVAANVLRWGTGALNIDGCRIGDEVRHAAYTSLAPCSGNRLGHADTAEARRGTQGDVQTYVGRWPANLIHDGSDEVEAAFPDSNGQQGIVTGNEPSSPFANVYGDMPNRAGSAVPRGDSGSAARFFYSAKAGPLDRLGSAHATIKPVDLMRWLVRLVTPPGGHVLEPFAGSGTTGIACMAEQMACTMIEMEADHIADIERKLALLNGDASGVLGQHLNARKQKPIETIGGLFA